MWTPHLLKVSCRASACPVHRNWPKFQDILWLTQWTPHLVLSFLKSLSALVSISRLTLDFSLLQDSLIDPPFDLFSVAYTESLKFFTQVPYLTQCSIISHKLSLLAYSRVDQVNFKVQSLFWTPLDFCGPHRGPKVPVWGLFWPSVLLSAYWFIIAYSECLFVPFALFHVNIHLFELTWSFDNFFISPQNPNKLISQLLRTKGVHTAYL